MNETMEEFLSKDELLHRLHETKCVTYLDPQLKRMIEALDFRSVPEDLVVKWLKVCRSHIFDIGKKNQHFIYPLLDTLTWIRGEEFQKEYCRFVTHLVSAFPGYYTEPALKLLIGLFSTFPVATESKILHTLIQHIMKIVPLSQSIVLRLLSAQFPYAKTESQKQVNYLDNLLLLLDYNVAWRKDVLQIILSKIMELDVICPRDEIREAEEVEDEDGDEGVFDMDIDQEEMADESQEKHLEDSMKHPLANTLDQLMCPLFTYLQDVCPVSEKEHRKPQHRKKPNTGQDSESDSEEEQVQLLFHDLLSVFSSIFLRTQASNHLQFVYFYLSARNSSFRQQFLEKLMKTLTSQTCNSAIRINAAAYLGSILARATFISLSSCLYWMERISRNLHNYIKTCEDRCVDTRRHGPFYAQCEALFYVFAFRHKEFAHSRKALTKIMDMDLSCLVSDRLNPLKVIHPAVCTKFASVTRTLQVCYCGTVIERNKRSTIPVVRLKDGKLEQVEQVRVQSFFAFDPYLLNRSKKFICQYYKEYQAEEDECLVETEGQDHEGDEFIKQGDLEEKRRIGDDMCMSWTDHGKSPGSVEY